MKKLNKYLLVIPMLASGFILPGAALAIGCSPNGTIYVNANAGGINDGSDWANAYTSLQDALGAAVSGEEIWVATGIYYPDIGTAQTDDDRDVSFELAFCVAIYGGFAGGETSLDDRDWETNVTTLSGDIDQDDDSDGGDNSGNSQHVVTGIGTAANPIDGTAILDGVVISGGNTANNGGGMHNNNSSPSLTNVTISGNSAANDGGGMYNYSNSSPTLTNVTFSGNSANDDGGGMFNYSNSSPTLTNVTISGNFAKYDGGGMYNYDESSPSLTNVTISGNSANNGGGMYNDLESSLILTNVTISGNSADNNGGGIYNDDESNTSLTNVTISGNSAGSDGGGMFNDNSSPTLTNITISGNSADEYGGGMFNYNRSSSSLTNVTISGNSANNGGGMYNYNESSLILTNVIIWGNTPNSIINTSNSISTISYSLIEGSGGSSAWDDSFGTDGGYNLDVDPLFISDFDDLHLQTGSPAINAGNDDAEELIGVTIDLDGNPRFSGLHVDMGAYEFQILDTDGDGYDDGVDDCPYTIDGAVVVVDETGCSIGDYCPCEVSSPSDGINHGHYISCVAHSVTEFTQAGLISDLKGDLVSSAARGSTCGMY